MTPDGWYRVHLSDVVDQRTEKVVPAATDDRPYVALEHLAKGSHVLLGWARAGSAASAKTAFRAGDVLFGKLRPYLRKAAPAPFDGLCSTDILPLFGGSTLDAGYLAQLAQWGPLQQHAVATSSGTKMPRTSWAQLGQFAFDLPPLPEQHKIAAILSSVDDAIEKTQAVIDQVQGVNRGLKQELLTRGLPGRHTRFKQTDVGEIPETWDSIPLESYCARVTDGTHDTPRRVQEGYPLLTSKNLRTGKLDFGSCQLISEDDYTEISRRSRVDPGDVLFGMIGTIGNPVVVPMDVQDFAVKNVALFKLAGDSMKADWLVAYLESPTFIRRIILQQTGNAQKFLPLAFLRRLRVPVAPDEERDEIVETLRGTNRRLGAEAECRACLTRVKAVLMSVLLTGELRVAELSGGT